MSKLMIDTSAYSSFRRGHSQVVSAMRKTSALLIPTIVLGELWGGFEWGDRRQKNYNELEGFLASPRTSIISVTENTAKRYAIIYAHLRNIGRPIPTNDLWIAALAMEHGSPLFTADAHFLNIPQIIVEHIG